MTLPEMIDMARKFPTLGRAGRPLDSDKLPKDLPKDYRFQLLRTIARDHPQALDDIASGKWPSVHAAAVALGVHRRQSPETAAHCALRKMSELQRCEFLRRYRYIPGTLAQEQGRAEARPARSSEMTALAAIPAGGPSKA